MSWKTLAIPDAELVERYHNGQTLADLADATDTYPNSVRKRLQRLGIRYIQHHRRGKRQSSGQGSVMRGDAVQMADELVGCVSAPVAMRHLQQADIISMNGHGRNATLLDEREVLSLVLACALSRIMVMVDAVEMIRDHGGEMLERMRDGMARGCDVEFRHHHSRSVVLSVTLHGPVLQALGERINA